MPAVVLVTAAFDAGARAAARARGYDDLAIVTFDADLESLSADVQRHVIAGRMGEIVHGLRRG